MTNRENQLRLDQLALQYLAAVETEVELHQQVRLRLLKIADNADP